MLYQACASHAEHCDTLTALDGRYALYPAQRDESSGDEYDAILDACRDTNTPCIVQAPDGPWDGRWGGEVTKRACLFAMAEQRSSPEDWYWVIDADFDLRSVDPDWRDTLAETDRLTAEITLVDQRAGLTHHPALFRALRGLTVTEHHWHYHVPGGPVLWDYEALSVPRETATVEQITVDHRDEDRSDARTAQRGRYYKQRRRQRIEHDLDPRRRAELRRLQHQDQARMTGLLSDVLTSVGAVAA